MRTICVVGLGTSGIKISRYVSESLKIPALLLGNEQEADVINVPQDKVSLVESEKITTEYDEYFINMLNRCRGTELLALISDFSDPYSISLTKVISKFVKKLKFNSLGIIIVPFRSEMSRYERAVVALTNLADDLDLIIKMGKDELFRAFRDVPIKMLEKVNNELAYMIIKNIFEALTIQDYIDISSHSNKMIGFGAAITDRMDKIEEAFADALSSPWLEGERDNILIILNGTISEKDAEPLRSMVKFKNFKFLIKTNFSQGRRIDIMVLNY